MFRKLSKTGQSSECFDCLLWYLWYSCWIKNIIETLGKKIKFLEIATAVDFFFKCSKQCDNFERKASASFRLYLQFLKKTICQQVEIELENKEKATQVQLISYSVRKKAQKT